jgi:hypothetical protein
MAAVGSLVLAGVPHPLVAHTQPNTAKKDKYLEIFDTEESPFDEGQGVASRGFPGMQAHRALIGGTSLGDYLSLLLPPKIAPGKSL